MASHNGVMPPSFNALASPLYLSKNLATSRSLATSAMTGIATDTQMAIILIFIS
jgi:hypothetical protein